MYHRLTFFSAIWIHSIWSCFGNTEKSNEYCSGETFKPSCASNEVILMQHALYGRMNTGRCSTLKVDSCSKDVLDWMDEKCSGKPKCDMVVPDIGLNELLPCFKEYMPYLEAAFSCIPVINPGRYGDCSNSHTISITSRQTTIASSITKNTKCGLPSAPWSLQAKPGQKINITIVDFNLKNKNKNTHSNCNIKYGYIIDVQSDVSENEVIDICSGQSRQRNLYVSHGNLVQIVFQEHVLQENSFLVQTQAVGCPDFNPPRNSWMRKEPNKVTIGCHESNDQWFLTCEGTRWIGNYDSCPNDAPSSVIADKKQSTLPNVISLTMIGGTTIVICCVAMTAIIVCFYYRKYKIQNPEPEYYTTAVTTGNSTFPLPSGTMVSYKTYRPVSTVDNRHILASGRSFNTNNPFESNTLTGQIINTNTPPLHEGSNIIDEVIYDDPANLDINNVQYMNQFNSLNSTGTGMVNSLQYTKLQKQRK